MSPQSSLRGYEHLYHASGTTEPQMVFDTSGYRLQVSGFIADVVSDVGMIVVWSDVPSLMTDEAWSILPKFPEESEDMIRLLPDNYTFTGEPMIEAFWRTLVGNKSYDQEPLPLGSEFVVLYSAF